MLPLNKEVDIEEKHGDESKEDAAESEIKAEGEAEANAVATRDITKK
jgi:hypothetical protein